VGGHNGARNGITDFQFADDVEDESLSDRVEIDTAENLVSNVFIKGENDVTVEVSNRAGNVTERTLIEGAVGKNMRFNENLFAQVNRSELNYDGQANFFVATEKRAEIKIDNDKVQKAVLWLGGKPDGNGGTYIGDIRVIDARGFDSEAELAGNATDNTIYGGDGPNSLWGGDGGNDLLIGGKGRNMFFYAYGNGNDTISGANEGDVVYLLQVTMEQIAGTELNGNVATINFTDGGKLIVNDAQNCSFVVGEQIYYVGENNFLPAKE
jgi:Ca2+-binding RTX toxin-like protein